jgi:hypothetical protein
MQAKNKRTGPGTNSLYYQHHGQIVVGKTFTRPKGPGYFINKILRKLKSGG